MNERSGSAITPQELTDIIKTYFDLSEIADLSFRLGVDHEEIKGQNKSDKARELVVYMERRGQLDRLTSTVWRLRPHIGINLVRVLTETFLPNDPKLKSIKSLLAQLRQYSEKLNEWKALHNHLDETINVFSQFAAQIERFAEAGQPVSDLNVVNVSWQPVYRRVNRLLQWAESDIKHIGKPYAVAEDGVRTGEKWAVTLAEKQGAIITLLAEYPSQINSPSSNQVLHRFTSFMNSRTSNYADWQSWWANLRDNTRAFDDHLRDSMFLADKELRKTAAELHDFSKETLWG